MPADVLASFRVLVLPSDTRSYEAARDMLAEAGTARAFGLPDAGTLGDNVKTFITNLTDAIKHAAADITSLEVRTFTSGDVKSVIYDVATGTLKGETPLALRAFTHIAFDGDILNCVPERESQIDEAMWRAHLDMVKEAQANRAQFLGAMAELATRLIAIFSKP
jgi:hypothetical protein